MNELISFVFCQYLVLTSFFLYTSSGLNLGLNDLQK